MLPQAPISDSRPSHIHDAVAVDILRQVVIVAASAVIAATHLDQQPGDVVIARIGPSTTGARPPGGRRSLPRRIRAGSGSNW